MGDCNEILNSGRLAGRGSEVCRTKDLRRYESIVDIALDSVNVGSLLWFAHLRSFLIIDLTTIKADISSKLINHQQKNKNNFSTYFFVVVFIYMIFFI